MSKNAKGIALSWKHHSLPSKYSEDCRKKLKLFLLNVIENLKYVKILIRVSGYAILNVFKQENLPQKKENNGWYYKLTFM